LAKPAQQRIIISIFVLVITVLLVTGTVLSYDLNTLVNSQQYTAGVSLIRTATLLSLTAFLGILSFAIWRTVQVKTGKRAPSDDVTPWFTRIVWCGVFVVVRLVWAIRSSFSAREAGAVFNPFRDSNESVWSNLGMVVVMEFLALSVCMLP